MSNSSSTPLRVLGTQTRQLDLYKTLGLSLTFARLPLLAIALWSVGMGQTGLLLLWTLVAIVISDLFDGILFEKSQFVSESDRALRHAFDAVADRVMIHGVFAFAMWSGVLEPVVYIPVLIRETALASIVLRPLITERRVLQANWPSKVATTLIAAIFYLGVNGIGLSVILVVPFALTSAVGLAIYLRRS